MKFRFDIDTKKMLHRFDTFSIKGLEIAGDSTYEFAKEIQAKTIPFTPKLKGPLRNTSKVTLPNPEGLGLVVEIIFDPIADNGYHYALIQHEVCWFKHTTPGTKCKYLEDVMNQNANNFESEIGGKMFKKLDSL
jgi:hypothetical protein